MEILFVAWATNRRCNSTSLNMVTLTFRSVLSLLRHRSLTYVNRSYGSESECAMRLCGHTPKKNNGAHVTWYTISWPFSRNFTSRSSQLPLQSRVVDGFEIVCHFMVSCFISWLGWWQGSTPTTSADLEVSNPHWASCFLIEAIALDSDPNYPFSSLSGFVAFFCQEEFLRILRFVLFICFLWSDHSHDINPLSSSSSSRERFLCLICWLRWSQRPKPTYLAVLMSLLPASLSKRSLGIRP